MAIDDETKILHLEKRLNQLYDEELTTFYGEAKVLTKEEIEIELGKLKKAVLQKKISDLQAEVSKL